MLGCGDCGAELSFVTKGDRTSAVCPEHGEVWFSIDCGDFDLAALRRQIIAERG